MIMLKLSVLLDTFIKLFPHIPDLLWLDVSYELQFYFLKIGSMQQLNPCVILMPRMMSALSRVVSRDIGKIQHLINFRFLTIFYTSTLVLHLIQKSLET